MIGSHFYNITTTLQEWGLEGYQLWIIGSQCNEGDENGQYATVDHTDIIQLQFAKSSLTVNPCMVCV